MSRGYPDFIIGPTLNFQQITKESNDNGDVATTTTSTIFTLNGPGAIVGGSINIACIGNMTMLYIIPIVDGITFTYFTLPQLLESFTMGERPYLLDLIYYNVEDQWFRLEYQYDIVFGVTYAIRITNASGSPCLYGSRIYYSNPT